MLSKYSNRIAIFFSTVAFAAFIFFSINQNSSIVVKLAAENMQTVNIEVSKRANRNVLNKRLYINSDGALHRYEEFFPYALPWSINFEFDANLNSINQLSIALRSPIVEADIPCIANGDRDLDIDSTHKITCVITENKSGVTSIIFPLFQKSSLSNLRINFYHLVKGIFFGAITYLFFSLLFFKSIKFISSSSYLLKSGAVGLYLFLAYGFVIFLTFNLHTSSIGVWKNYIPMTGESGLILGQPRSIRSDEWLVQTPFIASAIEHGFKVENQSLGAYGSALTVGVPVNHLYGYVQPRYWGFYLFGMEGGVSWLYAWRIFALLLSGLILFLLITRGDVALSLLGASWIYLSPFIQWWFGTNLPDMLIGMMGGVTSLYCLIFSRRQSMQVLSSVLLFFCAVTFAFALYPAFQIPILYCGLFIFVGLFLRDSHFKFQYEFWVQKLLLGLLSIACVFFVIISWYWQAADIISVIRDSVYPGKRFSVGGDYSLGQFLAGNLGQFLSETTFPESLGNVCEAASFLMLFPIAWLSMTLYKAPYRFANALKISLSIYIALMLCWLFLGYPAWLAGISQLYHSPPFRAISGIGIASIFLVISIFSDRSRVGNSKAKVNKALVRVAYLLSIAYILWSIWMLHSIFPKFFTLDKAPILLGMLLLWMFAFIGKRRYLFVVVTIAFVMNGIYVNPLTRGVGVFYQSDLRSVVDEERAQDDGLWLIFSNAVRPQYFKALGANVWNGVRFISSPKEMEALDPGLKYKDVWYRYAHVVIERAPLGAAPIFSLKQADLISIDLDPCSKALKDLGVRYLVFPERQSDLEDSCLKLIHKNRIDGYWLYKIKP